MEFSNLSPKGLNQLTTPDSHIALNLNFTLLTQFTFCSQLQNTFPLPLALGNVKFQVWNTLEYPLYWQGFTTPGFPGLLKLDHKKKKKGKKPVWTSWSAITVLQYCTCCIYCTTIPAIRTKNTAFKSPNLSLLYPPSLVVADLSFILLSGVKSS